MLSAAEPRCCLENVKTIKVEVSYALPKEQVIIPIDVPANATIEQAIHMSGVLTRYPQIDLATNKVGVFGKLSKLDAPLRPGDRVEIYRHLIADPKEVRRQRASHGKATKRGAGQVGVDTPAEETSV